MNSNRGLSLHPIACTILTQFTFLLSESSSYFIYFKDGHISLASANLSACQGLSKGDLSVAQSLPHKDRHFCCGQPMPILFFSQV